MKATRIFYTVMIAVMAIMITSCENTPAPTAEIFATIEGYKVTFEPTVTDTESYLWEFGDGQTSTEAKPVHTYTMSGTYSVKLTVTGEGGTGNATKQVEILPSKQEMLTGGPAATTGKTWILSTAYSTTDGGGPVTNAMPITTPSAENILAMFGLGAEYDNEFTFFNDGKFTMTPKNGNVLAGAVYAIGTQTIVGDPSYTIGMAAATFTPPTNATWTMGTSDFTVDAITDPLEEDVPPVHGNVTFTGKTWVSISNGGYFGILDFPTTARFIIKDITPTKMSVACFLCGYGYAEEYVSLPTNLIHITFVKK